MKKFLVALAMFVSFNLFSQEAILDSIEVYKPLPDNPEVVATVYDFGVFYSTLTAVSDKTGINKFIVVFYFKDEKDGPQKKQVKVFSRNIDK